jgi:hypothetical protein
MWAAINNHANGLSPPALKSGLVPLCIPMPRSEAKLLLLDALVEPLQRMICVNGHSLLTPTTFILL